MVKLHICGTCWENIHWRKALWRDCRSKFGFLSVYLRNRERYSLIQTVPTWYGKKKLQKSMHCHFSCSKTFKLWLVISPNNACFISVCFLSNSYILSVYNLTETRTTMWIVLFIDWLVNECHKRDCSSLYVWGAGRCSLWQMT